MTILLAAFFTVVSFMDWSEGDACRVFSVSLIIEGLERRPDAGFGSRGLAGRQKIPS